MALGIGKDLETEILVRLPAKSVMRFKCVKRSWNALFKTPTFVTRHKHMRSGTQERLIMFHSNQRHSFGLSVSLPSCVGYPPQDSERHQQFINPFTDEFPCLWTRLLCYDYINGILCLLVANGFNGNAQLILWNPCTREVKLFPLPPIDPSEYIALLFGVWVDPNTNDFKAVKILVDTHNSVFPAKVYNLNTNSCTVLNDPSLPAFIAPTPSLSRHRALVGAVYHWIIGYYKNIHEILCFSFRHNRFSILEVPKAVFSFSEFFDIAEVNGSFAYVVQYSNPFRLGIWVKYQHNWTKKYNIGPLDPSFGIYGILNDATKVIGSKVRQTLILCDSDGLLIRQFQINEQFNLCLGVHQFVESITPLSV
ncbi:hypothetical protein VNO77_42030 [Canavalia gladiata]|uniref:F-box associated beta-propeller type 1 domain-containing protein n=1 Tax=Canavalia gladiata TaxID=3824 RepID=A0AAN9JZH9_CANGL